MPYKVRNSTQGIEPRHRPAFWMEGARCVGGMQVAPVSGHLFEGATVFCQLGPVKVCELRVAGHDASWTHDLIRRADDVFLRVLFQRTGSTRIEQGDWRHTVDAGQWVILDGSRPHRIYADCPAEQVSLLVPRSELPGTSFERTRHLTGPYSTARGVAPLLYRSLVSTLEDLDDQPASFDEDVGFSLLDLFKVAVRERLDSRDIETFRETRLERIRRFIARNVADPALSVESIASAMNCSKRYLHSLFHGGETVSELIWSFRLEACARDLAKKNLLGLTITSIALSNGFSSSAHFSRVFKRRYGVAPTQFRCRITDPNQARGEP